VATPEILPLPVTSALPQDRVGRSFLALVIACAVLVPILNLLVPASSPVHVSTYVLTLIGKYLCYAMLALALDLVWGYCGILSLGHAAFFALGGYAMGMYLMRQIGPRGVYGDAILPDFMVFLNWQKLPWFWFGFNHFWFALIVIAAVPATLALVFGWFAFRSRVTGVYFSIMTQALSYALMLAFFRNDMGFGGNNGFTDFKDILGFNLHEDGTRVVLLMVTAAALAASYLACRAIVGSRAGRLLRAIRDAESRARFLGYRVESYKLWVFVFSAVLAGIAGALYVPQVGIINPSEFAPINSIEAVIWVAVGGRGTLFVALRARNPIRAGHAVPPPGPRRPGLPPPARPPGWSSGARHLGAQVARRRVAREQAEMTRPPHLASPDKILTLEDLTVSFDGFKALDGLTLSVDRGELRCIIGPNGAGKTTMMDVVTGKTRPDHGAAWFAQDVDLLALSEPEIAQAGIGRKFQKPTVFERLTVFENLELAIWGDKSFWKNLVARLTHVERQHLDDILDVIGLAAQRATLAGMLSHGQKQWLEIGMLLMQEPELLLVDEPVAGMTPQETERTAELLLSLAAEHSLIVVEHDMDFVRSIASRVTVLHEGRVLADGDMVQVQNDPLVVEVYLGA
jgi:urea transport system permease protein